MTAWFSTNGHLEKSRAYFERPGRRTYRQLVGIKNKKKTIDDTRKRDGFWHYAIFASPQLHSFPRITLHHHVIFTDDGETPWESPERMHRARRRVCNNWRNDAWRDRLFAFCSAIASGEKELSLTVGDREAIYLDLQPIRFVSPWSYYEDGSAGLDEDTEVELDEELDEVEDDDEETT